MAALFALDPMTIGQGVADLDEPEDPAGDRIRKEGGAVTAESAQAGTGFAIAQMELRQLAVCQHVTSGNCFVHVP